MDEQPKPPIWLQLLMLAIVAWTTMPPWQRRLALMKVVGGTRQRAQHGARLLGRWGMSAELDGELTGWQYGAAAWLMGTVVPTCESWYEKLRSQ